VLNFYEVGGVLVRRWVPMQRRMAMEAWHGDGWAPYSDTDQVFRYGELLTEARALALLHEIRGRVATLAPLSEDDARAALGDRRRRA
jgi:hypothetical protein